MVFQFFREIFSWIFCFTLSDVKMLEAFFRCHLLGKRVSRFKCQNVVLLCLGVVIQFLSKEFHGFVSHFQEFRYQKIFSGPVFLFVRGFQGVKRFVLLYLGVVSQFLLKEFYGYFGSHFQEFRYQSLFVKVLLSEVFKPSFCLSKTYSGPEYLGCQKVYVLVVGGFLYVQSTRGFSIKRFLQVLFFFCFFFCFFLFLWVYMLCQVVFFRFSMFVRVLDSLKLIFQF